MPGARYGSPGCIIDAGRSFLLWSDLSPFAFVQGCGEAMARALYERLVSDGMDPTKAAEAVAFRKWAPETLARIMEDCARPQNFAAGLRIKTGSPEGRNFWTARQSGQLTGAWGAALPPLTPYVGGDGKVYLREDK
jgi:hypothetical protein